jgi:hypothetical protein
MAADQRIEAALLQNARASRRASVERQSERTVTPAHNPRSPAGRTARITWIVAPPRRLQMHDHGMGGGASAFGRFMDAPGPTSRRIRPRQLLNARCP